MLSDRNLVVNVGHRVRFALRFLNERDYYTTWSADQEGISACSCKKEALKKYGWAGKDVWSLKSEHKPSLRGSVSEIVLKHYFVDGSQALTDREHTCVIGSIDGKGNITWKDSLPKPKVSPVLKAAFHLAYEKQKRLHQFNPVMTNVVSL